MLERPEPEGKKELLESLRGLSKAMENSQQRVLAMHKWYEPNLKHPQGYAACVIGEYVVQSEGEIPRSTLNIKSEKQAEYFDYLCDITLGSTNLSKSIYAVGCKSRHRNAKLSSLFTEEELQGFEHLNSYDPSPEEAKTYIDACITEVERL
ncbi:hypothetical protein HOR87_gp12 [Marinomonas phage CB5A]|nr:hypothetical protein HOR87_gp12 [Marinomonas phage CB5A]ASP46279.1 hypothetical protein [Marinomonas phage CB5A]